MAKVQAMRVVKSLTQKGLLKKESRRNKDNKGSTSNLYTLLNPKTKNKNNNGKNEGVYHRYRGWYLTDTLTIPILKRPI